MDVSSIITDFVNQISSFMADLIPILVGLMVSIFAVLLLVNWIERYVK